MLSNLQDVKHILFQNDFEGDDLLAIIFFLRKLALLGVNPQMTFIENAGKYPAFKVAALQALLDGPLNGKVPKDYQVVEGSTLNKWCEVTSVSLLTKEQKAALTSKEGHAISPEAFEQTVRFLYNPTGEKRLYIGISAFHDLVFALNYLRDPVGTREKLEQNQALTSDTRDALLRKMTTLEGEFGTFPGAFDEHGKLPGIDISGTLSANFRATVNNPGRPHPLAELTHAKNRENFFEGILGVFQTAQLYENFHSAGDKNSTAQAWPEFGPSLLKLRGSDDPKLASVADLLLKYSYAWDLYIAEDAIDTITEDKEFIKELCGENPEYEAKLTDLRSVLEEIKDEAFSEVPTCQSYEELDARVKEVLGDELYAKAVSIGRFQWNYPPMLNTLSKRPQFCLADGLWALAATSESIPEEALVPSKVSFDDTNGFTMNTSVNPKKGSTLSYFRLTEAQITQLEAEAVGLLTSIAGPSAEATEERTTTPLRDAMMPDASGEAAPAEADADASTTTPVLNTLSAPPAGPESLELGNI